MTTESKPLILDNTTLSNFRTCPRKFYYRHKLGLAKPLVAAPLNFGAAIHAGIAAFYRGAKEDVALQAALGSMRQQEEKLDDWRTPDRVVDVLLAMFKEPIPDLVKVGSEPIVEKEFAWPLIKHQEELDRLAPLLLRAGYTTEILWCGIVDFVALYASRIYVGDHKTTSYALRSPKGQTPYIDSNFWRSFKPHGATPGYLFGISSMLGLDISGVLINAIGVNKLHICFGRQTFDWTPEEIEEWRQDTLITVEKMLEMQVDQYFVRNPDSCTLYNSSCPFQDLCRVPAGMRTQLMAAYGVDFWNPLEARKKEAATGE